MEGPLLFIAAHDVVLAALKAVEQASDASPVAMAPGLAQVVQCVNVSRGCFDDGLIALALFETREEVATFVEFIATALTSRDYSVSAPRTKVVAVAAGRASRKLNESSCCWWGNRRCLITHSITSG